MKILFVASEVVPFAKTGGLADVAAALPKALTALGHDVRIVMPLYRSVKQAGHALRPMKIRIPIGAGGALREGWLWESNLPNSPVTVYFIEQGLFFDRDGFYQDQGRDYPDNLARFSFFSQAALQMLPLLGWRPDIIHAHDWQTALVCAHLGLGLLGKDPYFAAGRTVFTIHNLAYQGIFPRSQWPLTQLPDSAFSINGLEYYDQVNCLKGGLISARHLTTVSPSYAQEIQTASFGCGLEGILQSRAKELAGILNGIDTDEWNPKTDRHLPATYSREDLSGKAVCRSSLQRSQHLNDSDSLLIGMVQRLAEQKGIDLLLQAMDGLMRLPVQLVILGTGEARYQQQLEAAEKRFPGRLAFNRRFDNALAHQIEAGADAFLMPSRFEPCGLNQMYSMRYGTVPVVHRVGGLADTVVDATSQALSAKQATGFVFEDYTQSALLEAVGRACELFRHRSVWKRLMQAGMKADFSWAHSARLYEALYASVAGAASAVGGHPRALRRRSRRMSVVRRATKKSILRKKRA